MVDDVAAALAVTDSLGIPRVVSDDLDSNGTVDGKDILLWQRGVPGSLEAWKANYGAVPAAATTTPELSSALLLLLGLLLKNLTCGPGATLHR